ncbi:serine hydrolase [Sphingomonas sp.]|jgi:beta-lactamase class A|uniref:serine hydrolase n=1 Tax=Sphingomonas sp. TaxID=28214 RepID=UPI002E373F32|nr:serine hydrolase [Sphingomonas sp.]HEX4694421.1 serine hydrolase [Sphingomonas sp.]
MRGLIALMLLAASPATAQTAAPTPTAPAAPTADPATTARVNELVGLIGGTGDFQAYFSPTFHAALSKDKWDAVVTQVVAQTGKPLGVDSFAPSSPWSGIARLRFEGGIVTVQIAVDPTPPHAVTGLLFSGAEVAGDTLDKLTADFRALPGKNGLAVYLLGDRAPKLVAGINPDQAAPLGSAFKLWVLGELAREVAAGERKWADVIPVGPPSLPSGMTQSWPAGSPVTLQTLATLMISISDNTATDTLVTLEGRKLDAFVAAAGTPGLMPILTTRQMFAIKSAPNADIAASWAKATPAARRAMLDADAARLAATPLDVSLFSGKPVAVDTLEWFASPRDAAGMFDWLRTKGGATALALLAINPGTDATTRARFDYVGFKGGSEPGVLTLNYLVKRKDGRWLAITGNWHRSDADVELATFMQLMSRALVLTADAKLP